MANKSIFDAFERMWQHITVALSNKINKPSTATRGQVIAVKAVDEFNVPTEIGATDLIPIIDISTSFNKELVVDSESITMFSTYSEDSGYYDKNISRFINGVVKIKYKIGSDIYCDTAVIDFADSSNGRYRCSILNRNHAVAAGCNTLITVLFSISKTQETVTIKAESIPMKAYVDANAGGGGSSVQPDWNQNDSTQPDYMKNRTHWIEKGETYEFSITTEAVNGMGALESETPAFDYTSLENGKSYSVTMDDVIYSTKFRCVEELDMAPILGNGYLYLSFMAKMNSMTVKEYLQLAPMLESLNNNTGEPFFMIAGAALCITETPGTHNFIISIDKIVQLDEKFIPNTIARVSDVPIIPSGLAYIGYEELTNQNVTCSVVTNINYPQCLIDIGGNGWYVGDIFDITWDGTEYSCEYINGPQSPYVGNAYLIAEYWTAFHKCSSVEEYFTRYSFSADDFPDTGEPFAMIVYPDSGVRMVVTKNEGTYSLIIKGNVYHKLNERLIPNTIARTSDVPSLPEITSESEGKVLGIQNGVLAWIDGGSGATYSYAEEGSF